jgi:hypothetical protein
MSVGVSNAEGFSIKGYFSTAIIAYDKIFWV